MVSSHGGVDKRGRGGAASRGQAGTLYAYVSRGMLARRRAQDGRSSLFEADEVARLAVCGQRGQPRRAAGSGDFVIESGLTEIADGRFRYRGMGPAPHVRE
jgi:hypothetical protein